MRKKNIFTKKLIPTLQIAQTECGLCCTRTLLSFFGNETTLTSLRKIKEPGRDGLNLRDLKELLGNFGVESRIFKVKKMEAFMLMDYPVIAFWKGYHFVCIESFSRKKIIIMDPSIGRISISPNEFKQNFSGLILAPQKGQTFKKKRVGLKSKWSKKYIWPKGLIALYLKIFFVSIFLIVITMSIPIATQFLIDKNLSSLLSFKSILFGFTIAISVMITFSYLRNELSIKAIYLFNWNLINKAFIRILELPAKYFTVRSPGEIVYRLSSLGQIQNVLGPQLVQSILDFISGMLLIVYVFMVSPILCLLIICMILSSATFLSIFQKVLNSATDKEIREGSNAQNVQLDALVSINSVKLGGYANIYINDWKSSFKDKLDAMANRMKIQNGIMGSVTSGIQTFSPLLILIISLKMANSNLITLGQALAVQTITALIFTYSNSVFNTAINLTIATKYIELAEDIFDYPTEVNTGNQKKALEVGQVSLVNVDFNYMSTTKAALTNISFEIKAGETTAIVGVSGSGKTTLGKVISSLFEPTKGKIFFDGIEYHEYDLSSLRKSIGYIPQEAHLHNRTIIDNFKLGSELSDDEIISYCKKLKFLDFIDQLPMGYRTVVSELGSNLSGGQRQRIHIAKVLMQNPKILVMDEATSSLDNLSQKYVYTAIAQTNCSKVIIAHRLETILNADKIVVLSEEGKVVQIGTHNELINKKGLYNELYKINLKNE